MQDGEVGYASQEQGMTDESDAGGNTPTPIPCDKFILKRFKNVTTQALQQRLINETDYCQYYPEFIAKGLRRDRVIELLLKSFRGESHAPSFKRSAAFEYDNDKHLPYFPGTEPKNPGEDDGSDKKP